MIFDFVTAPRILFGPGSIEKLTELVPKFGRRVLLILGSESADRSGLTDWLEHMFPVCAVVRCIREPTAEEVDAAVMAAQEAACDVVVAVGGGSVLDCGKATAGMLTNPGSLVDYLEGVGNGRQLENPPAPLLAAPTTAGTGSEVTRNAVITGPGYKKSIRSPLLMPRVAVVDPLLTHGMPPLVTAACGMDALAQLIESYLSQKASPITDGLALQGIAEAGPALQRAVASPSDAAARESMAVASLLGGICLANAGLGAVHGFASPLGARFPIAHGVACAALLPQVMRANLEASQGTEAEDRVWLRFARVSEALTGIRFVDRTAAVDAGLGRLQQMQRTLGIPRLATLGVTEADIPRIAADAQGSSMRTNPVVLSTRRLEATLLGAL
jgi:alcohol dehydrogenase class IV